MTQTDEYAQFVAEPRPEDVAALSAAAQDLIQAEARVAQLQADLKEAQAEAARIAEHDIPELMDAVGVEELPLAGGRKIVLKDVFSVSPAAADRAPCWEWMKKNGHGAKVKNTASVALGKDSEKILARLREVLAGDDKLADLSVKAEEKVESSTLRAFVKAWLAKQAEIAGTPEAEEMTALPKELFGVYEARKGVIESPKAKRKRGSSGDEVF